MNDKARNPGQGTNPDTGTQAAGKEKKSKKQKSRKRKWLTEKFVPGQTKCRMQGCSAKVMVRSTRKTKTDNGNLQIIRHVKCQGPHRHSYVIIEIIKIK